VAAASPVYAGIEAGGTKFVCAIGEAPQTNHASASIATTTPTETLARVIAFFQPYALRSLGLAAFGSIDLDRALPTYGHILSTPKLAWQRGPIVDILQTALGIPVAILSPQRIIIGGGVMHQPPLLPSIREACAPSLHGYVPRLKTPSDFETYIVPPALGDRAGVIGALYLAQEGCSLPSARERIGAQLAT
jgi:predicted NBD/HSP70 family sugar kinase